MIYDKTDFLRSVREREFTVYAEEELSIHQDLEWVFLISNELTGTGAPIELIEMAECFRSHGKLPVIFSPEEGPLSAYCEKKRFPVIIMPDVIMGTFIDFHIHLAVLTVVNTYVGGMLIRRLNGNGHPVIWWIHESKNSYEKELLVQMPEELEENIHVLCVGEYTEQELLRRRPKYRTAVLPICVPEMSVPDEKNEPFSMLPKDKKIFLHVGTLVKNKGQDILIKAIEKLEQEYSEKAVFVFAGKETDAEIKKMILEKSEQDPEKYLFLGEVSHENIFRLYQRAEAVLCTSRADSMPTVMAEGMSASCLPVCTDNAGISAFIRDENCGLVYSGEDTDALADCLRKVIAGDVPAELYRRNALKTYQKYFSKDIFDENIRALEDRYCEKGDYRRSFRKPGSDNDAAAGTAVFTILIRKSRNRVFDKEELRETVRSVCMQTEAGWDLVLDEADYESAEERRFIRKLCSEDNRITVREEGAPLSAGRFVLFLENGITLKTYALEIISHTFRRTNADFVYSDHKDILDVSGEERLHYKPDYSPDTLKGGNYIGRAFAVRKSLLESCFGKADTAEALKNASAYSLILSLTEKAKEAAHIPEILWTGKEAAVSAGEEKREDRESLEKFLTGKEFSGPVEYIPGTDRFRIRYEIKKKPLVSIIICSRDHCADLKKCVDSIKEKTAYPAYEIIISDNGSETEDTLSYYRILEKEGIRIIKYRIPFHFPKMNNIAVKEAKGEYLIFLNNDTEIITPEWIEELMMYGQRPDVGVVGAKLLFRDNTIQHAGVIIGNRDHIFHLYEGTPDIESGYEGRLCSVQDLSCVTGACIMVRTALYRDLGGFDESYAVAYNDTDLCLRARSRGLLVVWTPFAKLYHDESKSRGQDRYDARKAARCEREMKILLKKGYRIFEEGDPYFNKHFSPDPADCSIKVGDYRNLSGE